ncbi:MAG: thioredoxin family protein [Bacteroidetes bacterium]|nr:thioredoxin family protein [Bacteroidota bacterium]
MKTITCLLATLFTLALLSFTKPEPNAYQINDAARDFSLKNVDGKYVALKDYSKAKGIILIFTCNHCPFSKAYEDRIITLHNKYEAKGFPVVAINSNDAIAYPEDSYENMQERAKDKKFPFAYLHDESQEIAKMYGATKTPHVYLLLKVKDKFIVRYIGAIDDNSNEPELVKQKYVEQAITEILSGQEISLPFTKAIGCSIKWKK